MNYIDKLIKEEGFQGYAYTKGLHIVPNRFL